MFEIGKKSKKLMNSFFSGTDMISMNIKCMPSKSEVSSKFVCYIIK